MQFHNPRNLAEAISIQAAELLALFLWKDPQEIERLLREDPEFKTQVREEMANIICFVLNFANVSEIDVSSSVMDVYRRCPYQNTHCVVSGQETWFPLLSAQRSLVAMRHYNFCGFCPAIARVIFRTDPNCVYTPIQIVAFARGAKQCNERVLAARVQRNRSL